MAAQLPTPRRAVTGAAADVVVIGPGLIGLASALAVAARGARVILLGRSHSGNASLAAAGMLAPAVERGDGAAQSFAVAARDRYPGYLDDLADQTGIRVPLNRAGILEVAEGEEEAGRLRDALSPGSEWLDPSQLAQAEPALAPAAGAAFHPRDGAVDNVVLHAVLGAAVDRNPLIRRSLADAVRLTFGSGTVTVRTTGERAAGARVVVASGAWAPALAGLPRPLPIRPVRGQMISYAGLVTHHVVYGAGGYLVPRETGRTLVGATMEEAGFDATTTAAGTAAMRRVGERLVPALARAEIAAAWAGLRPVTPDLLPILGADADTPELIYACGHSRNGVLLTPVTAEVVASIVAGDEAPFDIRPFSIDRFAVRGGSGRPGA